jgi:hypothetical protein
MTKRRSDTEKYTFTVQPDGDDGFVVQVNPADLHRETVLWYFKTETAAETWVAEQQRRLRITRDRGVQ